MRESARGVIGPKCPVPRPCFFDSQVVCVLARSPKLSAAAAVSCFLMSSAHAPAREQQDVRQL